MPAGRPTKYRPENAEQARKLCLLGATDAEMADFFQVEQKTIDNWKKDHPEFLQSITRGKQQADAEVAEKLFERAKGYSHPEDKIFNDNGSAMVVPTVKHYPPDTQAASLWLRNRQPGKWRDKQHLDSTIEHSGTVTHAFDPKTLTADQKDALARLLGDVGGDREGDG